jgi:histidyl-tRNA synthetase
LNKDVIGFAQDLAQNIRNKGNKVAIDFSFRKIGDQIKNADKMNIPNVICIGEEEVKSGKLKIKNLKTGQENEFVN